MLNSTSLAAGVAASVKNVQFKSEALNLPRKILILGTYDPAKVDVAALVAARVISPEQVGDTYGFGSMLHRLAVQAFAGSGGVETWVMPQAELGGAVAAAGSIDFTGSAGVKAGALNLYIAGLAVPVAVTTGMTAAQIATAVIAAITANKNLPVSAAVNGGKAEQVDITAKSKGPWGNSITIRFNIGYGEVLPEGVEAVVTAMATGAGVPLMADALEALGTEDGANEEFFTDVVHGYLQDATTLDAILAYGGAGNDYVGLYGKSTARPFRVLTGDTAADAAGLNALTTLSALRKTDRINGVLAVPGSASHPSEIAAQAIGHMARVNQDRAAQGYVGIPLIGIDPGAKADRWTSNYDNRDTAVKNGVSPTRVQNGVVTLQNVVTFYRPDNVPVGSNGYRSMRNISIIQNMLNAVRANFEGDKWQGISIVSSTAKVTNVTDRQKARDIGSVIDDLLALAKGFEARAWIYDAAFTVSKLKQPGAVTIRPGGLGFDNLLSVVFSGEGGILDTMIEFDTSLAVFLNN